MLQSIGYIQSMDYNSVAIVIRLAVVGSQICEISERIRAYSRSRSSKVIDLGINRKRAFLLFINRSG